MAQNTQKIDSLTNQAIAGEVSPSSSEVVEMVAKCQMETSHQIEQLEAEAAKAKTVPEKMSWNLRVKALKILIARLEGVCGMTTTMPTDEDVEWAKKLFGLEQ
jgi:hypothetical protein